MKALQTVLCLLLILALGSWGLPTTATPKDKTIVFGAQTTPDGRSYEVGFCAREKNADGDGPGHAFAFVRSLDAKGKVELFRTAGFSPTKTSPIHDGEVAGESYTHPSQECLIALTNKQRYERALSFIESSQTIRIGDLSIPVVEQYVLLINDCVTFMMAVAQNLGLEVPSRWDGITPIGSIQALKEKND